MTASETKLVDAKYQIDKPKEIPAKPQDFHNKMGQALADSQKFSKQVVEKTMGDLDPA